MTERNKPTRESSKKENSAEGAKEGRKRPIRVTRDLLVNKGPLVVPESVKKSGFSYFWMKDEPYKFEKYQRLGYDFAVNSEGHKVSVGRQGETMYLLEIPTDLHNELKALKKELKQERTAEIQGINKPRQAGQTEGIF